MPRRRRRTVPARDIQIKVRKNINLLDRPLFIPSREKVDQEIYNDERGYEIRSPRGLPVAYDIDILNLLLYRAQSTNARFVEFESIAELLRLLGYSLGSRNYTAVRVSLERWKETQISFRKNSFYIGRGRYRTISGIDVLRLQRFDDSGIKIEFDEEFFDINNSRFTASFPLKMMRDFSPMSKRLFEILKKNDKNFDINQTWTIGFDKMRDKLPFPTQTVNSKLLWALSGSCKEINRVIRRYRMQCEYLVDRSCTNNKVIEFGKSIW